MTKRKQEQPAPAVDTQHLLEELHAEDAEMRAKAVRSVCPCRLGFEVFEQCLSTVAEMQKDPDPTVRAAALHVFEDGYEMMSDGLPTSRRMVRNDMLATKIRSRGRDEAADKSERPKRKGHGTRADKFYS